VIFGLGELNNGNTMVFNKNKVFMRVQR